MSAVINCCKDCKNKRVEFDPIYNCHDHCEVYLEAKRKEAERIRKCKQESKINITMRDLRDNRYRNQSHVMEKHTKEKRKNYK